MQKKRVPKCSIPRLKQSNGLNNYFLKNTLEVDVNVNDKVMESEVEK